MKRPIVFFLLFSLALCANAQEFRFPQLTPVASDLREILPSEWTVLDSVYGDLNKDGLQDLALVLQYKDSVEELRPDSSTNLGRPRVLAVYFRGGPGWMRMLQHNTFITREGEGDMASDAYDSLKIRRGVLEIRCQFVRGHAVWKVRWQQDDLYLIGGTSGGVSGGKFYGFDANFLTRRARIEEGLIEEDPIVRWLRLPKRPLRRLSELPMIFSWEVLPYHHL